jgi:hypothetical protein
MKISTLLSLLPYASGALSCIRVHTNMYSDPFNNDGLSIEIWDDHRYYKRCPGCSWAFSSDTSKCKSDCGEFKVEVTGNGAKVKVQKKSTGKWYTLKSKNRKVNSSCCYQLDSRCGGYCASWDTCLVSNHGNCKNYACRLCDGHSVCGNRRLFVDNSTSPATPQPDTDGAAEADLQEADVEDHESDVDDEGFDGEGFDHGDDESDDE